MKITVGPVDLIWIIIAATWLLLEGTVVICGYICEKIDKRKEWREKEKENKDDI